MLLTITVSYNSVNTVTSSFLMPTEVELGGKPCCKVVVSVCVCVFRLTREKIRLTDQGTSTHLETMFMLYCILTVNHNEEEIIEKIL